MDTTLVIGIVALLLALLLALGVAGLLYLQRDIAKRASTQFDPPPTVKSDWRWTGRVDAIIATRNPDLTDDVPSDWVLRVEEQRVLETVADELVTEQRWRRPTRREVRQLVHSYHDLLRDMPRRLRLAKTVADNTPVADNVSPPHMNP